MYVHKCIDELKLESCSISIGPETEKARFPNFRFLRITAKSPRVDDRSPLDLEAEHDVGLTMDILIRQSKNSDWIVIIQYENSIKIGRLWTETTSISRPTCTVVIDFHPSNLRLIAFNGIGLVVSVQE